MRCFSALALFGAFVCATTLAHAHGRLDSELSVSPQGLFESPRAVFQSPRGSLRLEVTGTTGDFHHLEVSLRATGSDGRPHVIPRVRGNAFLPTDLDRIVAIEASESNTVPTRVVVLDLDGRALFERRVPVLTAPVLSPDGSYLAYRSADSVETLDLATLEVTRYPRLELFTVGSSGQLAGVSSDHGGLVAWDEAGRETRQSIQGTARRLAFSGRRSTVLVLTAERLVSVRLDSGRQQVLYESTPGAELRDLRVTPSGVHLGSRQVSQGSTTGTHVQLSPSGILVGAVSGTPLAALAHVSPVPRDGIAWPLRPDHGHPIGNTYGEYQNYGGSPYMHPGIDVLGADGQRVFAVKGGVVKAILTTSGQYHWRAAIGDSGGSGTSEGYLYAHLDEPTIAIDVGDTVVEGQYLGDLVPWPVAGFTHVHFARIEDTGSTWSGSWLCTENPQVRLREQEESEAPVFEPAIGGDLFAFATNETSNYLDPASLSGEVDIIVHVGDRIESGWVCAVQTLSYTIYPTGDPGSPIVDDKLAVAFDMELDTYQGGPFDPFLVDLLYKQDDTCPTRGDYSEREFFHIITNSDGDQNYEASDLAQAWDTTAYSDGDYVVEVTARDTAGNETTASMTVTIDN